MINQEAPKQQVMEQPYYPDDEIDLRELFVTLWRGKWIIIFVTFVFAAAGVFYALSKPNMYQANVLLAPAQGESGGARLSGQLGGLVSLAGINLGGGGASQATMAKEVLQSRAFLADFVHRHNLSMSLMAVEAWNMESEQWVINTKVYNPQTNEWLTNEEGRSLEPTDWDIVKNFKTKLSMSDNKDSGMITLSVTSLSPQAAKSWAEKLVHDINEHMREQDVIEAEARIAYLEKKLNETNIAGMQQVFYQLIEGETRTVMLANAQSEYIFKTVDPAVVPQERSAPKRQLIAIVATMLGGMLGVFFVFVRAFIRSGKKESESV
ncbi:Wzz/FepE/Etk N-terminal domain-containing protein [Marinobacter sp. LV10MA510-1]|uniref:Wzz/FepE/Etk N-terminal domain-containing protein n=1 Tax=Marinobacter sp. LV10MA510-1 TaxID=1415567 RepID=UPI000BF4AE69|nr:Wzz/FepE/Etk N-terminal domain-containing protein [Marinobacter sp. LV10MA510-1]PFG09285.1 LPS O-antigen subunit length determinant protein (WzzB/FepE family) [Marinobacter sp. LV10MA510-1]